MSIKPSVVTEAVDMDTEAHSCIKDKAKEEVRTLGCRLGAHIPSWPWVQNVLLTYAKLATPLK